MTKQSEGSDVAYLTTEQRIGLLLIWLKWWKLLGPSQRQGARCALVLQWTEALTLWECTAMGRSHTQNMYDQMRISNHSSMTWLLRLQSVATLAIKEMQEKERNRPPQPQESPGSVEEEILHAAYLMDALNELGLTLEIVTAATDS